MGQQDIDAKLDKMLTQLAEQEDLRLLNDHIHNYHWLADHDRWNEWESLLTEDTVFEYETPKHSHTFRGINEIPQVWGVLVKCYQANQHVIVNRHFTVAPDGQTASGHANGLFFFVFDRTNPSEHYMYGGRYEWQFVKTTEGWKTRYTRLQVIWDQGRDVMDEIVAEVSGTADV